MSVVKFLRPLLSHLLLSRIFQISFLLSLPLTVISSVGVLTSILSDRLASCASLAICYLSQLQTEYSLLVAIFMIDSSEFLAFLKR